LAQSTSNKRREVTIHPPARLAGATCRRAEENKKKKGRK